MIAEPGRFYVASAFTLATNIHSKRSVRTDENSPTTVTHNMYYINDGVYGSFNCLLYDHQHVTPIPLKVKYLHLEKTTNTIFLIDTLIFCFPSFIRLVAENWFLRAYGVRRAMDWIKLLRTLCCMIWNLVIG